MALARVKFSKQEFWLTFVFNSVLAIPSPHLIVKLILSLSLLHIIFNILKILLELLDWIVLRHYFNGTFEGFRLVLEFVAANSFLNEGNIGGKITIQLYCNFAERTDDFLDQIGVNIFHF